ncbi:MAG: heme-binding protein [Rickettsiales bacterium]|nr:heme-binding protein [Rickettsiales bacterium]
MRHFLTFLTLSFLISSCSSNEKPGSYRGYETATYEVSKKINNFEIRKYPPILVAEVEVEGTRTEAAKKGFRVLASYIFGSNASKQKVAMTSPVLQKEVSEKIAMTSPVRQISSSQKKWRVQFAMPKKYTLENLPKPENDKIKFKVLGKKTVVAIRFSGKWSNQLFDAKKQELAAFVAQNKMKKIGQPIISYYDDPFTFPWNRRNEIIQEIK